jgi:predicted TIM-barrel fold metal-dependent hydrolase
VDDYLDWARHRLRQMAAGGTVAFKTSSNAYAEPDRQTALAEFAELQRTGNRLGDRLTTPLYSYIHEELLKAAEPLGLPVAVHTGFWGVNRHDPAHFIPVIERHPNIHFDLFHSGIPYVRVLGTMAVNYPNTSINLCWAHSINMAMSASALDEYIDQVGTDKIIAFGGDVHWMVEKVYGHLELARQNVAAVLAKRVDEGLMDLCEAERVAQAWFVENPARIYRLSLVSKHSAT